MENNKKTIHINKISQLRETIMEAVKEVISEMDWKTYMNAARKRKEQADAIRAEREKVFPRSEYASSRNDYDDMADELEKYSQNTFQRQHGKNGNPHQYEFDNSPSYRGRFTVGDKGDRDFDIKSPSKDGYYEGEKATIRNYRYGNGFPQRTHGYVHDDTYDYAEGEGWDGGHERMHTMKYDSNGEHYMPDFSSVGDEVTMSRDKDYNTAMDNMRDDMNQYYIGKSKYTKGKGWE